jgi:hypothetical protein
MDSGLAIYTDIHAAQLGALVAIVILGTLAAIMFRDRPADLRWSIWSRLLLPSAPPRAIISFA